MSISNIGDQICFDSVIRYKVANVFSGGFGKVFHLQSDSEIADPIFARSPVLANHYNYIWRPEIAGKRISSREHQEAFLRECNFMLRLKHPAIISLLGVKVVEREVYALMPLCSGNLRDVLSQNLLPEKLLFKSLSTVVDALDYAYKNHEINHLDIKPENLLYAPLGNGFQFLVSDWGLARVFTDELAQPIGTMPYMAPERFSGIISGVSSDIFSIGIILHEVIVGSLPFVAKNRTALEFELRSGEYFNNAAVHLADYPRRVRELILQMVSPNVDYRFESYNDVKRAMARAI